MKVYKSEGKKVTLTAGAGGVTSGDIAEVGSFIGVVEGDAANGEDYTLVREGEFELPLKSGDTPAVGDQVYFDGSTQEVTTTATDNTLVGTVSKVGADYCWVIL